MQAEATPACCSALLRLCNDLLSGFESHTCVGSPPCFISFRKRSLQRRLFIPPSLPSVHCSVHDTYCCPWISLAEARIDNAAEALPCCIDLLVRCPFLIQATNVRTHPARVVARLWLLNLLFPFTMCI